MFTGGWTSLGGRVDTTVVQTGSNSIHMKRTKRIRNQQKGPQDKKEIGARCCEPTFKGFPVK